MHIDINCDLGESYGAWQMGNDSHLMPFISSANVACGFHGGDPVVIRETILLAMNHDVVIGAHPSYPDLQGFGRRVIQMPPPEVYAHVLYQIGALKGMVEASGGRLHHVKPHGALYNEAAKDPDLAAAIVSAVRDVDASLILYGLSGSELVRAAREVGLSCAEEVFADRSYRSDGSLTPRSFSGALLASAEQAAAQVLEMVLEHQVTATDGRKVQIRADTVCIHGDGQHALSIARAMHAALGAEGILVKPFITTS
jgi:UPF0271 protein